MRLIPTVPAERVDELVATLSRKLLVNFDMVLPFAEFDDFVPQLLSVCRGQEKLLYAAGHVSPDLSIAADRADLKVHELLAVSPFSADAETVCHGIDQPSRILYVANPNRVTGSNLGLADLESLAVAVTDGMLIVDEFYFDYFGISALPLLERFPNVAVLRSFTAAFGINSANSGYVISSPELIDRLRAELGSKDLSNTVYRTIQLTLASEEPLSKRLKELHDETLRVATELNRIGLQSRITAADFILMRVSDPTSVGNFLAQYRIPVENLDGYPQLQKYVRYRVQSYQSNDKFLDACRKMPVEYFRKAGVDRRITTLTKPPTQSMAEPVAPTRDRLTRIRVTETEPASR